MNVHADINYELARADGEQRRSRAASVDEARRCDPNRPGSRLHTRATGRRRLAAYLGRSRLAHVGR
jgi:hypothetical protein